MCRSLPQNRVLPKSNIVNCLDWNSLYVQINNQVAYTKKKKESNVLIRPMGEGIPHSHSLLIPQRAGRVPKPLILDRQTIRLWGVYGVLQWCSSSNSSIQQLEGRPETDHWVWACNLSRGEPLDSYEKKNKKKHSLSHESGAREHISFSKLTPLPLLQLV